MKKGVMQKWVKALRSGKYKQGQGALNRDGEFCCLGVLCEVAIRNGVSLKKEKPVYIDDDLVHIDDDFYLYGVARDSSFLPGEVMEWAGIKTYRGYLRSGRGYPLVNLNDGVTGQFESLDFDQIAAYIEANYEDL